MEVFSASSLSDLFEAILLVGIDSGKEVVDATDVQDARPTSAEP
jgi:hypothetical protein